MMKHKKKPRSSRNATPLRFDPPGFVRMRKPKPKAQFYKRREQSHEG